MTRKFGLFKLEDFHWFQLIVQIRAWGLMYSKKKHVLRQIQELLCTRKFVVSSDPRSAQQTAKSHLSWRVTWQRDCCHLATWYWVDTSWYYTTQLSWHWRPAGGGCWHWNWDNIYNFYNCQMQSHIISLKNARHVHPPPGPQGSRHVRQSRTRRPCATTRATV